MHSYVLKDEGKITHELAKLDAILGQPGENGKKYNFLANLRGDLMLCFRFIQENMVILGDHQRGSDRYNLKAKRIHLCEDTRKRFVNILTRTARAHEGASRQERIFIQQFWYEIQQGGRANQASV